MVSEDRPNSDYRGGSGPRPSPPEDTLKMEKIHVERKTFIFTLKENPRGRFLRITEEVGGRRDTIIIPSTGLGEVKRIVEEMMKAAQEAPSPPRPEDDEEPLEPPE